MSGLCESYGILVVFFLLVVDRWDKNTLRWLVEESLDLYKYQVHLSVRLSGYSMIVLYMYRF